MQATQSFYLARELGGVGHLAPVLERVAADYHDNAYVRAMLALAYCEAGDDRSASDALERLLADDFLDREAESAWGVMLGFLSEVAAETGSEAAATVLYGSLAPFEGRLLTAVLGLGCLGAADRYLGMLALTLRRWESAEVHFEGALTLEDRIGGRALLPRTRYWQARFLRGRGANNNRRAADALLAEVAAEAARARPGACGRASRVAARGLTDESALGRRTARLLALHAALLCRHRGRRSSERVPSSSRSPAPPGSTRAP